MKPKLLIVDDEGNTRNVLERFLRSEYDITQAKNGLEAIDFLKEKKFNLILTDLKMPMATGLEVLLYSKTLDNPPPCIVVTAYGSIETAVEMLKAGAVDFEVKPVDIDSLKVKLNDALNIIEFDKKSSKIGQKPKSKLQNIIGNSKKVKELLKIVEKVAPARTTVLITGESGTGKELIAEALHKLSGRTGKFIPINCAALSVNLLESELFGHEQGSFTGAVEQKIGRFELAQGGTLFLDEIAEINMTTQVKLLRVLENHIFERVGGIDSIKTDARIVTATNKDLNEMVKKGEFREDLYYRLDVLNIHSPPLRERGGDIPLLVNYFLKFFSEENGKETLSISDEALSILVKYIWKGNIRELRNSIEKMVVLSDNNQLQIEDIPSFIQEKKLDKPLLLNIQGNEKNLIISALDKSKGNITKAASILGINRRTLHRKINKYGL